MQNLELIISEFDIPHITGISFSREEKMGLSRVYFIDEKYVLRGRPLGEKTIKDFKNERRLLYDIKAQIHPIQTPVFIQSKIGDYCVVDDGIVWTLSAFIPGEILFEFSNTYTATEEERKLYLKLLHGLQSKTKGLIAAGSHYDFIPWMSERLKIVREYLSYDEHATIEGTLLKISESRGNDITSFVHGDFHPGNILLNSERTTISGLIDLDWCRVGSIYEDLSCMVLCFLRDISKPHFVHDEKLMQDVVSGYPEQIDLQKLKMYILIRCMQDYSFFIPRTGQGIDEMKQIHREIITAFCELFK